MPKISVCIATHNRQQLLASAIESVMQQTEPDFELIVCDDGSTDGTPNMMAQLTDDRIRYIRHVEKVGKSNNMISGFEASSGKYFIKFDDDDRLTPEFLSKTSTILEADPSIDFVSTDHWIIDINNQRDQQATQANSHRWGRTSLPEGVVNNLLEVVFDKQCLQIGATLFRRETLQEVGYMLPNIQNCEDNDLLVRLALAGKKAYYFPECLMEYRVHDGQKGITKALQYFTDKLRYLESYQFDSDKLEQVRRSRITETKLFLGLRMIETGQTQKGRELVQAGASHSPSRARAGLALSLLPIALRKEAFALVRKLQGQS